MALTLTATLGSGIREVVLEWSGNTGRYVTIYRSTSEIDITPAEGVAIDWSSATPFENVTGNSKIDGGLSTGTYYYYVTDGTGVAAANAVTIEDSETYAPEIQPDYVPTPMEKVSSDDAFRAALNNGGSVKFNPITLGYENGKNNVAIVAITGSDVSEKGIGAVLSDLTGIKGFAVLQTGTIQNFSGYNAQLSGTTQIKYVK